MGYSLGYSSPSMDLRIFCFLTYWFLLHMGNLLGSRAANFPIRELPGASENGGCTVQEKNAKTWGVLWDSPVDFTRFHHLCPGLGVSPFPRLLGLRDVWRSGHPVEMLGQVPSLKGDHPPPGAQGLGLMSQCFTSPNCWGRKNLQEIWKKNRPLLTLEARMKVAEVQPPSASLASAFQSPQWTQPDAALCWANMIEKECTTVTHCYPRVKLRLQMMSFSYLC